VRLAARGRRVRQRPEDGSPFNVNIPDDEAQNIRTVHDAIEGVRKLLDGGQEPIALRA